MSDEKVTHENIFAALAAAQGEFPKIAKNRTAKVKSKRTGQEFEYQYCTLDAIFDAVRPPLAKHGLAIRHVITRETFTTVEAVLTHSSGSELRSGPLIVPDFEGDMQALGSGLTYVRRYTVNALLGICPEEDDDAQQTPPRGDENPFRQGDGDRRGKGRRRGDSEHKPPKGGPPSGESKPVDPVFVSQKAFVACKSVDDFGRTIGRLENSTLLQSDLPKFTQMHKFAASHLEARCQKKEFDRDSPEVGALFDRLLALVDRMSEVEDAAKSQGEPVATGTPATQQGIF